jgi:DNA anti-recombination protein RmuC
LTGNTDIEDGLARLDKLTQEEARMASAELLKVTHDVDDRVKSVEGKVQDVRSDVHNVDDRVQAIGSNISSRVQAVDDKLDQVNRSLFLQPCSFKPLIPLCR